MRINQPQYCFCTKSNTLIFSSDGLMCGSLVQVQNRFEGGLAGEQARSLEDKLERELLRAEALALEADRHKEIADIASEQTLAMNHQVSETRLGGRIVMRSDGGAGREGQEGGAGFWILLNNSVSAHYLLGGAV